MYALKKKIIKSLWITLCLYKVVQQVCAPYIYILFINTYQIYFGKIKHTQKPLFSNISAFLLPKRYLG